jgi:hypothetical protein
LAGTNGTNGTNGDNITTLTGGTLGDEIGDDVGVQLSADTVPLFMAPGNGADYVQGTVQVPVPAGTACDLQVQLWAAPGVPGGPGAGDEYTFILCDNAVCNATTPDGGVTCTVNGSGATPSICTDDFINTGDAVTFNAGDGISIVAFNSEGDPATVDVSWSLDFALGSSTCPTPTPL